MYDITDMMLGFPSKEWGEDRLFFGKNYCGVIDGATPIDVIRISGYMSQAEWFADMLKHSLEKHDTIDYFPKYCEEFINSIRDTDEIHSIEESYNLPCATIASVSECYGMLCCWILGDCGIAVLTRDNEVYSYSDHRVSVFSNKTLEAKRHAIEQHLDVNSAIRNQKIKNREHMNVSGGYWTVAVNGMIEKEFVSFRIPIKDVAKCIVYTDGLSQISEMFNYSINDLLGSNSLSNVIKRCISNISSQDDSLTVSHIKRVDDIGFIVIEPY